MYSILLVVHVMITLALIAIILMQNNSGDMGSLSGSSSTNFMSGRAAASFITRATSFLGAAFILTSLALGIITSRHHEDTGSIMDRLGNTAPVAAPATIGERAREATAFRTPASKPAPPAPAAAQPAAPAKAAPAIAPATPSVPRPE